MQSCFIVEKTVEYFSERFSEFVILLQNELKKITEWE